MPLIPRDERLYRLQPPTRGGVVARVVEDVPCVRSDAPRANGIKKGPFCLVDIRGDGHHRCGLIDAVDRLACDIVLLVNTLAVQAFQALGEGRALASSALA